MTRPALARTARRQAQHCSRSRRHPRAPVHSIKCCATSSLPTSCRARSRRNCSIRTAISDEMRRVLHAPEFQRLDAVARSAGARIREPARCRSSRFVLDASREDAVEICARAQASSSARSSTACWCSQGGAGFSLAIADLTYSRDRRRRVRLLAGLGAVAGQAGACLLAAADVRPGA